jgi:hypothetical protein
LDKENGILVSYSLAGNMHYTGERRFAIMEKRRFNSQRRKYKISDAEKFATELTKYLGMTLKRDSNLRRSYLLGIRGRATVNLTL